MFVLGKEFAEGLALVGIAPIELGDGGERGEREGHRPRELLCGGTRQAALAGRSLRFPQQRFSPASTHVAEFTTACDHPDHQPQRCSAPAVPPSSRKATRASSYKSTSRAPPKAAARPGVRPCPAALGHLMNMHASASARPWRGLHDRRHRRRAQRSAADLLATRSTTARAPPPTASRSAGCRSATTRANPASARAPHPEFEANLRLRHGPGALEVCVRALAPTT